ncbi:MAG: hypothetical protein EZS28_052151, partial [Streblomastix strix]
MSTRNILGQGSPTRGASNLEDARLKIDRLERENSEYREKTQKMNIKIEGLQDQNFSLNQQLNEQKLRLTESLQKLQNNENDAESIRRQLESQTEREIIQEQEFARLRMENSLLSERLRVAETLQQRFRDESEGNVIMAQRELQRERDIQQEREYSHEREKQIMREEISNLITQLRNAQEQNNFANQRLQQLEIESEQNMKESTSKRKIRSRKEKIKEQSQEIES